MAIDSIAKRKGERRALAAHSFLFAMSALNVEVMGSPRTSTNRPGVVRLPRTTEVMRKRRPGSRPQIVIQRVHNRDAIRNIETGNVLIGNIVQILDERIC